MISNEYLEKNLQRIHEWIRSADQKVSIFLAFEGVVLSFLYTITKRFVENKSNSLDGIFYSLLVTSIVCFGYSLLKLCFSLISRTKNTSKKKKSISFFGDIASLSEPEFKKIIKKSNNDTVGDDLVSQIYVSSVIAAKKHKIFQESLYLLFLSVSFLILAFSYYFLWSLYAK